MADVTVYCPMCAVLADVDEACELCDGNGAIRATVVSYLRAGPQHPNRAKPKTLQSKPMDPADRDWSREVKRRDGYRCRFCRTPYQASQLEAHHIFRRNRGTVRLELDNGITLCAGVGTHGCHAWAHAHEDEFHAWVRDSVLGAWRYDELAREANRVAKVLPRRV